MAEIKDAIVNIETKIAKYSTQKGVEILPEVKNIIGIFCDSVNCVSPVPGGRSIII
jgi:hypothetical protein